MVTASLTSAAGILSLLEEPENDLKAHALEQLNVHVDQFWAEISDWLPKIETLYEDTSFKQRELAALVTSKVYYHLGAYEESLNFALGAGKNFDLNNSGEFVQTMISKCIDTYTSQRQKNETGASVDPRLSAIVERMFQKCFDQGHWKEAIGLSLESRRLDVLESTLNQAAAAATAAGKASETIRELFLYTKEAALTLVQNLVFRNKVLGLLVTLYQSSKEPDYLSMCQCLVFLNDHVSASSVLKKLVEATDKKHHLLAFQVAFDLYDNANQEYLTKLAGDLPKGLKAASNDADAATKKDDANAMETDELLPAANAAVSPVDDRYYKVQAILTGEYTIKLHLEFLYRNNHFDSYILDTTKGSVDSRSSVYHQGVVFSNAFMNAGTTNDEFLRKNLEWLGKASNWAKFSATATLGVIHRGQIHQGRELLKQYLPKDGVTGSPYSEGGALYALGFIHANQDHSNGNNSNDNSVLDYLLGILRAGTSGAGVQSEVVQHGACLGIGVASLGSDRQDVYEELKGILFTDSAVAGEAAALAMGMVLLGTGNAAALDEMLQYAHETQHEKIIRGLALGISLIMFGQEEQADVLISTLLGDKDSILRYGGVYTLAMAYCGTGNNRAVRKLLHVAVSDTNDDVRRAAVTALGFLLYRTPSLVPRMVKLLAESYNPHVRQGACFALGVACAGTGLAEAISLLEPLTRDTVDYVRQGAFIALSMVSIQSNAKETSSSGNGNGNGNGKDAKPSAANPRALFAKVIGTKNENSMAKLGAILAQGILEAGGRNVTIRLDSPSGHRNPMAAVGLALFSQFWYWYPLTLFISLSFTPTALIALDETLAVPDFTFVSQSKPSLFAYPETSKPASKDTAEKLVTAVLSTTAKAKARAAAKKSTQNLTSPMTMETSDDKEDEKKEEDPATPTAAPEKKEEEPTSEKKVNLTRVLPAQWKYLSFPSEFQPVLLQQQPNLWKKSGSADSAAVPPAHGIMILDCSLTQRSYIETKVPLKNTSTAAAAAASATTTSTEDEPAPPPPFQFSG